jgi:HEAT repeat protein
MASLQAEVERFKAWAAVQAKDSCEWECDYEGWSTFLAAAHAAFAGASLVDADIDLILYALARDNECENILDMLEEHPLNGMSVARVGVTYPDRDARWQVAVFLGTRDDDEGRSLLRSMVLDEDEYVRRRALLAIVRTDPIFAEDTALTWLCAEQEYARIAALTVLHKVGSPRLKDATERLKDDPSPYVRKKVAEIQDAV